MDRSESGMAAAAAVTALLLLPIIYWEGVYDFTRWPRLVLLQILTLLMVIAWNLQDPDNARGSSLTRPILAFLGWQIISSLWAPNSVEALQRISQAGTFSLFGLTVAHTLSRDAIRRAIYAVAAATGVVSVLCIGQYWGISLTESIPTAGNPSATFGYRNYLATYLIVAIPIIAAFGLTEERSHVRSALSAALVTSLAALICTRTRGAWVGLGAAAILFGTGCVVYSEIRNLTRAVTLRRTVLSVVAVAVIGYVGLSAPAMRREGQFRFDEHKSDTVTALKSTFSLSSTRGRTTMWENTLHMIARAPVVGVGLGGWQFRYPEYDRGDRITENVAPQRPHNDILWILAETGGVGLALYTWILISAFRLAGSAWRTRTPDHVWSVGLFLGVVAYVVHSLFSYPLERIAASALVWFAIGALAARASHQSGNTRGRQIDLSFSALRGPVLVIAALILTAAILLTSRRWLFDTHYADAIEAWNRKDWSSVKQASEKALSYGPFDFRAHQLSAAGNQKMGNYEEAEAAFTTSFRYHANEGHLAFADLLAGIGRYEEARRHYRKETILFPNRVPPRLGIVTTSRALEDWEEVLTEGRALLRRSPRHLEARLRAGEALEAAGDLDGARTMYEAGIALLPDAPALYTRYATILSKMGRFEPALHAHRKAATLAPDDPKHHNNIGAVLVKMHRLKEAATSFRRAIDIDTSYARAYRNLGDVLEKSGDVAGAISAYRGFIRHWRGETSHLTWAEQRIQTLVESP